MAARSVSGSMRIELKAGGPKPMGCTTSGPCRQNCERRITARSRSTLAVFLAICVFVGKLGSGSLPLLVKAGRP